jgi:catechol 2,3-dioxygenase-like lactoylglutathione lyase family enzyme
MIKILQIKETCLYITDVARCKSFYHDLLGLPIISEHPNNHIFFSAGSSVLLCFLVEKSRKQQSPPAHYAYGKQHIAFEVAEEDYEATKDELRALNISITYEHRWPNGRLSAYFEDFDGHVLEIVPYGLWD